MVVVWGWILLNFYEHERTHLHTLLQNCKVDGRRRVFVSLSLLLQKNGLKSQSHWDGKHHKEKKKILCVMCNWSVAITYLTVILKGFKSVKFPSIILFNIFLPKWKLTFSENLMMYNNFFTFLNAWFFWITLNFWNADF